MARAKLGGHFGRFWTINAKTASLRSPQASVNRFNGFRELAPPRLAGWKYQVVIPKEVRGKLNLRPGQKVEAFALGSRIELVPIEPIERFRPVLEVSACVAEGVTDLERKFGPLDSLGEQKSSPRSPQRL